MLKFKIVSYADGSVQVYRRGFFDDHLVMEFAKADADYALEALDEEYGNVSYIVRYEYR